MKRTSHKSERDDAGGSVTPRAVDLFSGCGGLTLGLKQAGFRVIGAVEANDLAATTYAMNHPEAHTWVRDIRGLSVATVKRRLGLRKADLELLAGCPPCQGFSTLRTLNGHRRVSDTRNDLLFEFLRFVEGLEPQAVMMENVPGLARDRRMDAFVDGLGGLGYTVTAAVLDAAEYGVPQRRRRLILVGSRRGSIRLARATKKHRTVRSAIGAMPPPGESGDQVHDFPERRSPRVRRLIQQIPKDGGSRSTLARHLQLRCHRSCDGFKDVYGRMAWETVSPTITSGCVNPSKGRFLHPVADRCITLREAALLQGFPRTYAFSLSRGKFAAAEMIGNALPPEFVRRHAVRIHRHLQIQEVRGAH